MTLHIPRATWIARALLALSVLVISWLSVMHVTQTSSIPFLDKIEHALAFLWLAACAHVAFRGRERGTVIALVCYGLLIELVQWQLPWREFSLLDWVADTAGILTWLLMLRVIVKLRGRSAATAPRT